MSRIELQRLFFARRANDVSAAGAPVGIVCATGFELLPLKLAMGLVKKTRIDGRTYYWGPVGGRRTVTVRCGVGMENAGRCAEKLICDFGCAELVAAGVAGALDPGLSIGDIVVSTETVRYDTAPGSFGTALEEPFPADPALRAAAVSAARSAAPCARVVEGRVCSGDRFISTEAQRERLASGISGACCDMESAAIARVCGLNRAPFVSIRAVSDRPGETGPLELRINAAKAALRCAAAVRYMMKNGT